MKIKGIIAILFLNSFIILSQKRLDKKVIFDSLPVCPEDYEWIIVFEEDFKGSETKNWYQERGYHCYSNVEQQWTTRDQGNVTISLGNLIIKAVEEQAPYYGKNWQCEDYYNYTSGCIISNRVLKYGKFEALVKIPYGKGFWPAFWLYGEKEGRYNEIDIFEFWTEFKSWPHRDEVDYDQLSRKHHMAIHYEDPETGPFHSETYSYIGPNYAEDYYLFSMEWNPYSIIYSVNNDIKYYYTRYYSSNDEEVNCDEIEKGKVYFQRYVFPDDPMRIILNFSLQEGENRFGGNREPEKEDLPAEFKIEYVKLYKRLYDNMDYNPCKFNISANETDYLVYRNITLGGEDCPAVIKGSPSGEYLDLVATEKITLKKGFRAEYGSHFSASIYNPTAQNLLIKKFGLISNTIDNSSKNQYADKKEIRIIPAQDPDHFTIIGLDSIERSLVEVQNIMGEVIYRSKINTYKEDIDMSNQSDGIYYVIIVTSDTLITRRILKL